MHCAALKYLAVGLVTGFWTLTSAQSACTPSATATAVPAPVAPSVSLLYRMDVQLGQRFSLGPVPSGQDRIVIPIVGGTFSGPKLNGKVLNVGADWRLTDVNGKYHPDTRYNVQLDDGTYVYLQTEGPTLDDGRSLLRARFETATNGTWSWLNEVVAVGVLSRSGDKVLIDMWQVSPN